MMCFGVDLDLVYYLYTPFVIAPLHVQVLKYNVNNTYNGIYIVLFKEGDIMY